HVFKLDNPRLDPADTAWPGEAPQVSMLAQGYQYLTETRFDQIEPVLEHLRRDVIALGLPLRSVEIELGPSQCEFTFHPQIGLARAAAAFTTPTINGYKRYRAYALAPDRVIWGHDNRGVMIRALRGPGDGATRLENRVGEPAANPYLYMAAQIVAGRDGIARKLDPGPSADTPYECEATFLPKTLDEALMALREDRCFAEAFGQQFIDYYLTLKQGELARYHAEVSEWEQK